MSPEQAASAREIADSTGQPVEVVVDWIMGKTSPPVAVRQAMLTLREYALLPQLQTVTTDVYDGETVEKFPKDDKLSNSNTSLISKDPEAEFASQRDRSSRKQLGQFFTPRPLANLMASWLEACSPDTVLDPAVGPGILLDACASRGVGRRFVGVDVDGLALAFARGRLPKGVELIEGDYLSQRFDLKFDAVISNPPYVRHHSFEIAQDVSNRIIVSSGQRFGKLTNLYVYFILHSIDMLRNSGRGAFLIPAEWANANYGQGLKDFFRETGFLKRVVYFSHEGLPFADNLSTACILCVEKTGGDGIVATHYVNGEADISSLDSLEASQNVLSQLLEMKELSRAKKWDALLASTEHDHRPGSVRLGELGRTRRGIATGDNSYFMLDRATLLAKQIPMTAVQPCISKATDAQGFIFDTKDFEDLVERERKAYLFNPPDDRNSAVAQYLDEGVKRGVADRYLTRAKPKWYRAEERIPAPIWVTVFGRGRLKFLRNKAGCRNLTAFHCLYTSNDDPLFQDALVACLNSDVITGAVAKHQRVYGGGLLKMEPKDILDIDVPDLRKVNEGHLRQLARQLEILDHEGKPSEALNHLVDEAFNAAAKVPDRLI